jgi:glycosyltransferase involved in cell wall biosynthesis
MKISIVIPVYNEAESLSVCLDAISKQISKPFEVIVVDNNSEDDTVAIALKFNFVKLINEPRQGVVHARTTGFNATQGDIIARIDGDTVLPSDWTQQIETVFADEEIAAASGQAEYYGVGGACYINAIDLFFRRRLSHSLKNRLYLWGANMAIRREAWQKVSPLLCQKGGQHEDFDLAIHLQSYGGKVVFDERMVANVSSRRIDSDFIDFMHYAWVSPNTYAQHGIEVRRQLYPIVLVCAVGYFPAYLLHKGYSPVSGKFSIAHLLTSRAAIPRVDPTANAA